MTLEEEKEHIYFNSFSPSIFSLSLCTGCIHSVPFFACHCRGRGGGAGGLLFYSCASDGAGKG